MPAGQFQMRYRIVELMLPSSASCIVLFTFYKQKAGLWKMINAFVSCPPKICLFADETTVMGTGASDHIMTNLNNYLDQLGRWLITWKIKDNSTDNNNNCQYVYFTIL
ncbi:hypothetical protein AVEN_183175-1 [Araneus ventricosus]|uniref:Reverse transcriptase domain-containing protein n=1 Tax=Araneus ventricosus TaxID=182803 RepID=A0A4Y2IY41_ARAVE|nr:hypothetical protein AVEN_183175-1 [Araneus ventricosus]